MELRDTGRPGDVMRTSFGLRIWELLVRLSAPISLAAFLRSERGATAIEYSLMLGLVVLASVAAFTQLGQGMTNMYGYISSNVISAMPSG